MRHPSTNFVELWKRLIEQQRLWFRKPSRRYPLALILFLFLTLVVFSFTPLSSKEATRFIPFFGSLQKLLTRSDIKLQGEDEGRVNILLLGIGGGQHAGGLLTDTMMLASVNPKEKKGVLLSIPRDLVVPMDGLGWRKINSVHALAELNEKGSGGPKTIEALSSLLEIPIPYYIRIDFTGFEQLIDELGGISVTVDQTLDDPRYPVPGRSDAYPIESRYEHLVIPPGQHWFDGATALKYARSRRGGGKEGSDFARSKRQQKIILAIRERALSFSTLLRPQRLAAGIAALGASIDTNLSLREMLTVANLGKNLQENDVTTVVLDTRPGGFLLERITNGAFILEPREGNFDRIRTLVKNIFDPNMREELSTIEHPPRVIVENGTTIAGLAASTALLLEQEQFNVIRIGNAEKRDIEKTTIVDFTNGGKEDALLRLTRTIPADVIHTTSTTSPDVDFLLVLGYDATPRQ